MSLCNCPLGESLPTIEMQDCPFEFGQLRMIIAQRLKQTTSDGEVLNKISNPSTLASWTALKTATDDTKVIRLPYVHNPAMTPGDSKIFGENSNETPDGAGIVMGENPTTVSGNFAQQPMKVIQQLKQLECEKLGIYLVDSAGRIYGKEDLEEDDSIKPIPIKSFFIKSPEVGNSDNPTKSDFQLKLDPHWYFDIEIVTPSFNALIEL